MTHTIMIILVVLSTIGGLWLYIRALFLEDDDDPGD